MKISACWIAKNESENIRASIESVKNCAEELIVVDTGSTDYTIRIAKECGARVYHFEWINDFAAARNYALSLAAGEYVIFIDADEYFFPALTKEDGETLIGIFEKDNLNILRIPITDIEKKDGSFINQETYARIFRKEGLYFANKIHETALLADGTRPRYSIADKYHLLHTGYSGDIIKQKLSRNLEILEAEQKRLQDPVKLYSNAVYLMRELLFLEKYEQAADICRYTLANNHLFTEGSKIAPVRYLRYFYCSTYVVEMCRHKFSRKEIYGKLFTSFKENYPGTWDALLAELHYQLKFDYREDRFLRELAEIEPVLLKMQPGLDQDLRLLTIIIFEQAAEAAHLRGDREKSCRFAYRALEWMPSLEARPVLILLYSLRGCGLGDIEAYLKTLAVPGRPDIAGAVLSILKTKDAVKKLIENAALPTIFPPERRKISVVGAQVPEADRAVFFRFKAEKFFAGMRYEEITGDPDAHFAATKEYICAYYLAYAQLMQEEYGEAYTTLVPHLKGGMTNQELLSLLLVTVEKAPEPLAAEARQLYEESLAILNETVDLSDIINTGLVYGAEPPKEKQALKELTLDVFRAGYEKDQKRPVTELLLNMHKKAASVLEQKGCVLLAAESYRLLLAKGRDTEQNNRNLTRLFRAQGNNELAEQAQNFTPN
ncbi:MAG: glycosyltransferase family 2 protein [Sporomusaceae bacterium]|jgi:glycosyltransferase involved in cell wall biosynthesis|nr:glycosyltransferase family 2 protein [Sporomusaceae bacterium]